MRTNIDKLVDRIESEGFTVPDWKMSDRRVFTILDSKGNVLTLGMYSNELRAWFLGYLEGKKREVKHEV